MLCIFCFTNTAIRHSGGEDVRPICDLQPGLLSFEGGGDLGCLW